ncbi:hypothetical protein ppKF707_0940 [Metapseudomonas furukawaii]|uniref:Uncharacterized protein n=1 Tax=Metapseudomonas furukawaii TaxID=1149133 RepID=A0AAD1FGR1_METFU|nr:hypothetical protein ppKF707_0940 [Pseudomonas furukawaii]BAU75389.1 hypothetical protein KF707C_37010 [Pseudomonas furukawaii]
MGHGQSRKEGVGDDGRSAGCEKRVYHKRPFASLATDAND